MTTDYKPKGLYERYFKRLFDVVFSLFLLVILSPVLLVVSVLVYLKLGSPVLFTQARPGKDEVIFNMYKFRSMTDERDSEGNLLPDSIRLTRFGRLLRSTSLDELPELFNILKGEMSFVGPRPLLISYLDLYDETQKKRHHVRPGLTGYAQANGRNALTWEEKFEKDVYYTKNVTFLMDISIIFKTALSVLKREGISGSESATMIPFEGTKR